MYTIYTIQKDTVLLDHCISPQCSGSLYHIRYLSSVLLDHCRQLSSRRLISIRWIAPDTSPFSEWSGQVLFPTEAISISLNSLVWLYYFVDRQDFYTLGWSIWASINPFNTSVNTSSLRSSPTANQQFRRRISSLTGKFSLSPHPVIRTPQQRAASDTRWNPSIHRFRHRLYCCWLLFHLGRHIESARKVLDEMPKIKLQSFVRASKHRYQWD